MEPNRDPSLEKNSADPENVKVVDWEDFENELARFVSLSSALNDAKEKKQSLKQKLEVLIQANAESLGWLNELENLHQKLDSKKMTMEKMSVHSNLAKEDASKREEKLIVEVRSLLVAGTALSVARKALQEPGGLLSEETGFGQLRKLQEMLRTRQQYMVSQISMVYPVKISVEPAEEQELEAYPSSSVAGDSAGLKPVNQGSLTILGLHLTLLSSKMCFFTDKKEIQKSATALGYIAHAVLLIASYLRVPLRYPLRLGGSHSYIIDNAPSIELTSSSSSSEMSLTNTKHVEFPLFFEGQDTTRAAYAVFLLNKDLEQLLNFIGAKSLGPRHVLANLRELLRTIQSSDFIDDIV